jgi:Na+-translocating ferredoxin:NAD+ oxidoreductase RnfE subunit
MKLPYAFKSAYQQQHVILSLGLGLFILLAGGGSLTRALMMTLAFALNLGISSTIMFGLRRHLLAESKLIISLIVMASVAIWLQRLAITFLPGWVQGIETYLPLIAVSGLIVARVETVALTSSYKETILDALGTVVGFATLVIPLGLFIDVLGQGVMQLHTFSLTSQPTFMFSWTILPGSFVLPIFQGTRGAIGVLLVAALWLALVQRFRGRTV